MAFDPDAYLTRKSAVGGFDPDAYLARVAPASPPDAPTPAPRGPSKLEAFGRGLRQGITFGFADELAGALEAAFSRKTYEQARDEARAADRAAREAHPKTFVAGELASALVPGTAIAKGAKLGAQIARGAGAGLLAGAGKSEATEAEGVLKEAATSGLVGAAVGGVAGGVARKVFGEAIERSDARVLADLGKRATKTQRDRMAERPEAIVRAAREAGLDRVADKPLELAPLATAARKAAGDEVGEHVAKIGTIPGRVVLAALREVKRKYEENPALASQAAAKKVDAQIAALAERWRLPAPGGKRGAIAHVDAAEVQQLKSAIQEGAFAGADLSPKIAKRVERDTATAVKNVLDTYATRRLGAEGAEEFRRANERFGALRDIEMAARYRARLERYPMTGLRDIQETTTLVGLGKRLLGAPLRAAVRPADAQIARLVRAAQAGDENARLALRALQGGVPTALAAHPRDVAEAALSTVVPETSPY